MSHDSYSEDVGSSILECYQDFGTEVKVKNEELAS